MSRRPYKFGPPKIVTRGQGRGHNFVCLPLDSLLAITKNEAVESAEMGPVLFKSAAVPVRVGDLEDTL